MIKFVAIFCNTFGSFWFCCKQSFCEVDLPFSTDTFIGNETVWRFAVWDKFVLEYKFMFVIKT